MSRARVARRIATAAAYGGGGIGLLGGAAAGLVLTEMRWARRRVGKGLGDDEPPVAEGIYGTAFAATAGPPWRLAMLGDSTAAGLGVRRAGQTPGALLASGLAAVSERPVELHSVALSGARSADLERQVSLLLTEPGRAPVPDVCVIMIGANDVTGRVPPARSVKYLAEAVSRLRTAGCQVIVGTCPDLGSVEPVGQPLRWIARRLSRQLAAAQTIAVVELGGRTVSLGTLLGPEFAANPRELFGPDRYHPSAEGYATAAMAVLPTLCDAVGAWPAEERTEARRRERLLPVADAAAAAVAESGTEVSAAEDAGRRTPWAMLRLRRRRPLLREDGVPAGQDVTPGATCG
ncbi:SGNH/GDSL hydrolase family protein [Streptomyces litchfieldiae]|uniref:SGNH/GDSL hydrolase family protein n=1 Tax=Streptomyces litchfieldiae TaxID=3075543 RepID=A0ABU2MYW5_9ACTN|nr:SGNH/GDSL hydrolase family protein [Streptomyces sp. DSM 44938]MDT0346851.1 SGNH/GDSL hydrolase family protein [Streptomyces sp. DSM 44938]